FAPLAHFYTIELTEYLQRSLGWLPVKKGDFFPLFWRAWVRSFTESTVLSSFRVTGIYPPDSSQVLDRFTHGTPEAAENSDSSTSVYSGDDWVKIQSLINAAVKDNDSRETRKLHRTLHHLSVQNQLIHHELHGLKEAVKTRNKHNKKPKQAREEKKEIQEREKVERRIAREEKKKVRERERVEQAAEKQRQKDAHNAAKTIRMSQTGKKRALLASTQKSKRQKRVVDAMGGAQAREASPSPPPVTTSCGRNVRLPSKFK
ncbi:hypothetical protein EJ07DRAFT_32351, partial [Lizonia empirigonia]